MRQGNLDVVLVPGFMLDESMWDDLVSKLPASWRIHRAQLAGGSSIAEIAQHIAERAPPQFLLLGFSLGGYVARQIAADYPDRMLGLVLIASSLRSDTPAQRAEKQVAIQAMSNSSFKGFSTATILALLHPKQSSNAPLIQNIRDMGVRLGDQHYVTQSGLSRDGVPSAVIRCPTLVVAAPEDRLRSIEEAQALQASIPGASLEIIEESGHLIPLEQAEHLADVVVSWAHSVSLSIN